MAMDLIGLTPLLQVYDMPTSIRFYRDLLGFEVIETSPVTGPDFFHWAMLRLGGATLMLNTAYEFDYERPVPPDAGGSWATTIRGSTSAARILKKRMSNCRRRALR